MDTIKKAMLAGLGAISLTKEKAAEIIDDLVKRGELKEKDRKTAMDRMLREASVKKVDLERKVASSFQKTMSDMGLPTKKDFQPILKRLDAMEKAIETLNNSKQGPEA